MRIVPFLRLSDFERILADKQSVKISDRCAPIDWDSAMRLPDSWVECGESTQWCTPDQFRQMIFFTGKVSEWLMVPEEPNSAYRA